MTELSRRLRAADLFCGAGGASSGFVRACEGLGLTYDLLAINHWPIAVQTHSLNHPGVRHLCEAIERVNPREAVPSGRLDLLLAGPECTHHSTARGGRPVNDQSRATAWHILKWAQELYIATILIENVPEFCTWGPLGANGRPLKSKRGEVYRAFLAALRALGYRVDERVLTAADYGDPTTRKRLFILARRGRLPLRWPAPTHSRTGGNTLFGRTDRWRPARDVIDWSLPSQSIFQRKRPLRPATMARIMAGLERFGGQTLQPFLVILRNHMAGQSVDEPLPTVAAEGGHVALAEPFLVPANHGAGELRSRSVDEPVPTLTGRANQYLVEPFILQQQSGGVARSTHEPLPTITTDGAQSLVTPYLVPFYGERQGQAPRTHGVDDPMPVIPATGDGKFGLVEPFLQKYNSTGGPRSVDQPIDTISTKDRYALVQPVVDGYVLDIHFRMLQPHELSAAMSFPHSYQFAGNRAEQVKQIGNAWAGLTAQALCQSVLMDYLPKGLGVVDVNEGVA
jgi:DNA (cytosine-5)-methyltransferase 1